MSAKLPGPIALAVAGVLCLGAPLARASTIPQVQHVVIIMQENRSFDHYFGTFPGANGLPSPAPCLPLYLTNPSAGCLSPFHDVHDTQAGAAHFAPEAIFDIDNGLAKAKMDGFLSVQVSGGTNAGTPCDHITPLPLWCWPQRGGLLRHDVIGYHTDAEIPNYWAYAEHFKLLDGMYPGVRAWSGAVHLQMTSEWAATCTDYTNAMTCSSSVDTPSPTKANPYPWANLFQFFDANNITWKYYLGTGAEPDCEDETCAPAQLEPAVYNFWNPAPYFQYVINKPKTYIPSHVTKVDAFLLDIKNATLPQVSWIVPSQDYSEHPPAGVTLGMDYVTSLINAVMQSPYWQNTVIFLSWDDWGGFYDHAQPPLIREPNAGPAYGFGIRVPAITIGAYVVPGIDHATYSFDNYTRFIEDVFIGSARLNPAGLGVPDNRPYIADSLTSVGSVSGATIALGDIMNEFDFTQTPLPPLVLSTGIPGGLTAVCSTAYSATCTTNKVTLSWDQLGGYATLHPIYHVTRDGVEVPTCNRRIPGCADLPGHGTHLYRIYSVIGGVASPPSAAVEITEP